MEFLNLYNSAAESIVADGEMVLCEPTKEERKEMTNKIKITLSNERKPIEQILEEFFSEEYPAIEKADRMIVISKMNTAASTLTEEQIKQRAKAIVEALLGVNMP